MMTTEPDTIVASHAICDGRPMNVPAEEEKIFSWGRGVVCCGSCACIVEARESWMEVYGS